MHSNACFDLVRDRELFVIRWRAPTPEAFAEIGSLVRARYEEVGPLVYVAIIGADAPPPDPATREALMASLDAVYECLRMVRVVLLGSGLRMTVTRSITTAMTLASGMRGRPFHVDKTLQACAAVIGQKLRRDPDQIVELLLAEGIVLAEEL